MPPVLQLLLYKQEVEVLYIATIAAASVIQAGDGGILHCHIASVKMFSNNFNLYVSTYTLQLHIYRQVLSTGPLILYTCIWDEQL